VLRREWAAAERAALEHLHTARESNARNHELIARAAHEIALMMRKEPSDLEDNARCQIDRLL
jgi:hypothetical protein